MSRDVTSHFRVHFYHNLNTKTASKNLKSVGKGEDHEWDVLSATDTGVFMSQAMKPLRRVPHIFLQHLISYEINLRPRSPRSLQLTVSSLPRYHADD